MSIGIRAAATYVPRYRLSAAGIREAGRSGGRGSRSLAGHDEDSLTMAVEAARRLPAALLDDVETVVFCTTSPPYLVKNNATAAHAALGLPSTVPAYDLGGAVRSVVGALLTARPGTLLLAADVATARPGGPTELDHGDGAVAVLIGAEDSDVVLTRHEHVSEELLDIWRLPEQPSPSVAEDRFPVSRYLPMAERLGAGLDGADRVVVSGPSARAVAAVRKVASAWGKVSPPRDTGFTGAADLLSQVVGAVAGADAGTTVAALSVSDGADLLVLDVRQPPAFVDHRVEGIEPPYLTALTWRGTVSPQPPRRPEPGVVSAPAAARGAPWKYGLRAATCLDCGHVSTPPQLVCVRCRSQRHSDPVDLTRAEPTIRTFSVDRLAYSLAPPLVAAVVGFEGGARLEIELTDTDPEQLAVGRRLRMTFRRRHSSGGVHNYAWKATVTEE